MARPDSTTATAILSRIDDYLQTCGREQTSLPTRYGFAKYVGISTDSLADYEKKSLALSGALKAIDDSQKEQLMTDGMYGGKEVNSSMAIFLLKANHGLMETSRQELTGANGGSLQINVIDHEINIPKLRQATTTPDTSNAE